MSVQTKYFDEDGKIVINRSQDIQPILDFNKERNIDGHNRNPTCGWLALFLLSLLRCG